MTESRPLDFEETRDSGSESWHRADPVNALIEQKSPFAWTVSLPDGDGTHHVTLIEDDDTYLGRCTCEGFQYHDNPCAHLCTIRQGDVVGDPDVYGNRIQIEQVNRDPDEEPADQHDGTERARADGGREVRHQYRAGPHAHEDTYRSRRGGVTTTYWSTRCCPMITYIVADVVAREVSA